MCDPCRAEWWRWLDTRPSQLRPGLRIASHAVYDDTAHGIVTNRRHRYEDWSALVRRQQSRIREQCERDHQAPAVAS